MKLSLTDYVMERGKQHFGQSAPKDQTDVKSALYNNRRLLQYLFRNNQTQTNQTYQRRISDMKYQEISGQLNYFSEKLHVQLNKKHLPIDGDLYKLQNVWVHKKIPDFYCYYFLKFTYANSYSRMHELILSELQNMSREKDSYSIIKKTIDAREVCLMHLRKQITTITDIEIYQSIETLKAERAIRRKKMNFNDPLWLSKKTITNDDSDQVVGQNWKSRLQIIFQLISHLRKLTSYVIELIKNWRIAIYNITEDPRRFRERVIFYYDDINYLLKVTMDNRFMFDSFLKKYLAFANHYDPFFMKPLMVLENKERCLTEMEDIFLALLKPTEFEMNKMIKALIILAEEQYDEDSQSKLLQQRKSYGAMQQGKQSIGRTRAASAARSQTNFTKTKVTTDPLFTQQYENGRIQKISQQLPRNKSQASVNRMKRVQSVDLKKVSPYANRNQRIAKAQRVLEIEHKLQVAQRSFSTMLKRQKEEKVGRIYQKPQWTTAEQQMINNKIFNNYIQENLKLMEETNKKAYVYRNSASPAKRPKAAEDVEYNKISFRDRKQIEYYKNLEQYQRDERAQSQCDTRTKHTSTLSQRNTTTSKGTRAIIQISNKGIRNNQSIIEYDQLGRRRRQNPQKAQTMKIIEMKLNPKKSYESPQKIEVNFSPQKQKQEPKNLFETEQQPEIVIMRQQPQKIQQIKQFLYTKIKQELIEELKKSNIQKQADLNNLIEEEKRKKLQEIIEQRRIQEERLKQQEQKRRLAKLQQQRKKLDFIVKVQPIQCSEENVSAYLDKIFEISPSTYHRLYLIEKVQEKKQKLLNQFYAIFLRGFSEDKEVAYAVVTYDWSPESGRKFIFQYVAVKNVAYFVSSFHQFCQYIWKNDPALEIQFLLFKNAENQEGNKIIADIQQYANKKSQTFETQLYSNISEIKYLWKRPPQYGNLEFPYSHFQFSKFFNLKCELLSSAMSLNQKITPKIDMNLQVFTNYIFLLEELFRKHLTPQQVVELRENSTNIRRLKDIFRIIIELERSNPTVNELTLIEGLNLQDLYEKMKERLKPPYNKYYWHNFYDRSSSNRLLLAILKFNLELQFSINACLLNDKRYLKINSRRKILTLRSSVYSQEPIYILNTNNSKIRMFLMAAEHYKLMRIQLFVFLNLIFNNIVEDTEKYVHSFWFPQFVVNSEEGKEVKRITDFSITMKKSFFLAQQIYYANYQYIKSAISFTPKKSDIVFKEAVIVGFLHTDVQASSTGMPIYAKMIDKQELFKKVA